MSRMAGWFGVCVLLMLACAPVAVSQTLEEVERQVEAAERKQREQAAAARREAEARAAREAAARREREQSAAAAAAAEARMGTLIVQSDHACKLSIDGSYRQDIGPGETASLKVQPGDQLIDCVSTRFPSLKVQEIKPLAAGSKSVVVLGFGDRVAQAEATREQREREEALARRFQQRSEGIFDSEQGVIWAASDNGSDIDWNGARSYCASKGGGWSLPTSAQLQSLKGRVGPMRYTEWWYWSSETSGSAEAFHVYLGSGNRHANAVSDSLRERALCVRRP